MGKKKNEQIIKKKKKKIKLWLLILNLNWIRLTQI